MLASTVGTRHVFAAAVPSPQRGREVAIPVPTQRHVAATKPTADSTGDAIILPAIILHLLVESRMMEGRMTTIRRSPHRADSPGGVTICLASIGAPHTLPSEIRFGVSAKHHPATPPTRNLVDPPKNCSHRQTTAATKAIRHRIGHGVNTSFPETFNN